MLFPNHPAFAELRAGMGYAPGARSMGYAPGARAMGDLSTSEKNLAVDADIDTSDIDLLDSLGATDQDMQNLINGNTTLPALYAKYGVSIPSATATATASTPAASAPPLESPKGSTLLFTCNWTAGVGNLSVSPASAIASLTSALTAHNMSVVSSQTTSSGPVNYGIQVLIQDNVGHDTIANELTVPTAIMQGIVGNNFSSTPTLSMVTPGGSTGTASAVASLISDPISFLENNGLYIALGIGGLILLNNFTGKRR